MALFIVGGGGSKERVLGFFQENFLTPLNLENDLSKMRYFWGPCLFS